MKKQAKLTDFGISNDSCKKESPGRSSIAVGERPSQSMAQRQTSVTPLRSTPKKRKEKFSDPENHALVDEIINHLEELNGKTPGCAEKKKAIWDNVVRKVNGVSGTQRSLIDCKKRWNDYRRKIKSTIAKSRLHESATGEREPLEAFLTRRQLIIAKFFKMGEEDNNREKQETSSDSCLEEVSTSITSFLISDSEEDFDIPSKKSSSISSSIMGSDPQNKPCSQASEAQISGQSFTNLRAEEQGRSNKTTLITSFTEPAKFDSKIDELIAQQKDTNEILENMRSEIHRLVNEQRKMCRFLKKNFVVQQKSIMSTQKMARDHQNILDLSLKNLHNKIDELNNTACEKSLQGLLSSDESDASMPQKKGNGKRKKKRTGGSPSFILSKKQAKN
ncbi:uncharacterized protein LOC128638385 [Bombina bombina]|uniref:uncharacterized protein LOC128638385 n=1 Tax=Bombina bombina TaxID=8345 RepID=UPI00235AE300|nr:uncharacterized protein LOC128638385 [Bombina bombina]XP_053546291.1 uncharacterized protein LOC128638385 [Bombina bombina]XP_053546292.1 uncharacterized protein LOC128638385 [Bombina bombina]